MYTHDVTPRGGKEGRGEKKEESRQGEWENEEEKGRKSRKGDKTIKNRLTDVFINIPSSLKTCIEPSTLFSSSRAHSTAPINRALPLSSGGHF